jgi:hypothetical protein
MLLQDGHLWGSKEVAIPTTAVTGVEAGIRLNLSKKQVGEQLLHSPLDVVADRADDGQVGGLWSACGLGLDVVLGGELENCRRRFDLRFGGLQDRITVRRPPGGQDSAERGPVQVIAGLHPVVQPRSVVPLLHRPAARVPPSRRAPTSTSTSTRCARSPG